MVIENLVASGSNPMVDHLKRQAMSGVVGAVYSLGRQLVNRLGGGTVAKVCESLVGYAAGRAVGDVLGKWLGAEDLARSVSDDLLVQTIQECARASQPPPTPNTRVPGPDGFYTVQKGDLQIRVKPVDIKVPPDKDKLAAKLEEARKEKDRDDERAYGELVRKNGYKSLKEWAEKDGYYGSPPHRAWAEASSARTGYRVPPEYWMEFDPFGGTAGQGPNVLPEGKWPGAISRIAMGHDADWNLGRYFGVGPMAPLRGATDSPSDMGMVGLKPDMPGGRYADVPLYSSPFGLPDWEVNKV